ncbi:helix-turn-helix transcriptional regulator [Cellulosimicrobium cellulans]|uniref:helix-turn-helix transcriptional regulator n=1 Tax=Cellulosimicrobium cellulans TaxID=1710 RepID=UPI0008495B81|nr:LuxR C-terminal-related transcriptional regulator [Cellulosimicrobium cellulans]
MPRTRDVDGHRLLEQVARRCARADDPLRLLQDVAAVVRRAVPYAAAGWLLVDPDTLLLTGVHAEGVTRAQHLELIEAELTGDDVNRFWELAERDVAAASLSAATGGDLSRSARWARVYGPAGYGDELRTVFRSGSTTWGHACLTRRADEPSFAPTEVALVARACPHVGSGLRASLLLASAPSPRDEDAPALVVLDDDGTVRSVSPRALERLGPLEDASLATTIVLHEVAQRTRALAAGAPGPPALARARSVTGEWLVVRGTLLDDGRAALVCETATRAQVAPVLLRLHQLTDREREVTQLLLRGTSTAALARQLWITPETVRGHVKTIFAKLGVNSRPQLAALLADEPATGVVMSGTR